MTKEEFKILRKRLCLTQLELSQTLYVHQRTISRYELGQLPIPKQIIDAVIEIEKNSHVDNALEKVQTFTLEQQLEMCWRADNDHITIDARGLWEALGVQTKFSTWIERKLQEGTWEKGLDYFPKLGKTLDNGRPLKDYVLSLDMAKELCLLERTEAGQRARKWFIARSNQLSRIELTEERKAVTTDLELVLMQTLKAIERQGDRTNENINDGFSKTHHRIDNLTGRVQTLENTIPQRRKRFSKPVKTLHIEVIYSCFSGYCPCCRKELIVGAYCNLLSNAREDHIHNQISNASKSATWYICYGCNYKKETGQLDSTKVEILFNAYQVHLRDYENGVLNL